MAMTFGALDFTDYSLWMNLIIIGTVAALIINYFIGTFTGNASTTLFGIVIILAAWGLITVNNTAETAYAENATKAKANIMAKYDLANISWYSNKTPTRTSESNTSIRSEILVITKDGKQYDLIYEVNNETSEPTLTAAEPVVEPAS